MVIRQANVFLRPRSLCAVVAIVLLSSLVLQACHVSNQANQGLEATGAALSAEIKSSEESSESTTRTPEPETTPVASPTLAGCESTTGRIVSESFESETLGQEYGFEIYLPPCYSASGLERYPVIYLLHGLRADQKQWEQIGVPTTADGIISGDESAPFIVVMPLIPELDTFPSKTNTHLLLDELVPYIDAHYLTLADRDHRAVGWLSRGASWALRLSAADWKVFGKIGLHSLPLEDGEILRWVSELKELPQSERPQIFLDTGNNDQDLGSGLKLDSELTKANIPHTWHMFAGYHNQDYWSSHLAVYLEWYTQGW